MRGNLLNARSTNRDVRSLGLLRSCAVPARMFIKYLEKRISTSIFFGVSLVFSVMIFFVTCLIELVMEVFRMSPNRIRFRVVIGTIVSPISIFLSHTFAAY